MHAGFSYNDVDYGTAYMSNRRSSKFLAAKRSRSASSGLPFLAVLVALSWMSAWYLGQKASATIRHLEYRRLADRKAVEQQRQEMKHWQSHLQQAKDALAAAAATRHDLEHEVRMITELALDEDGQRMTPTPQQSERIDAWLEQRRQSLQQRVRQLAAYVQDYSRQQVLQKYGPGPHRVQFTVELDAKEQDFVVELASLEYMPHASHFFLDMIDMHLFDHTIFLHHEKVEHVIAGLAMDYRSLQLKNHHLAYLGWQTLAFPEYSVEVPHEKYTIGFARSGPTFYLNTMDNTRVHGPGGQGHHVLPEDADPCFGRVVQGEEVVDALVAFGMQHRQSVSQDDEDNDHPWRDEMHSWTHLVKAVILKD